MENANIVWQSHLDKKYNCIVTRIDERNGLLKIVSDENKEVLLEQKVGLSYGAIFGPDIDDVREWEQICINKIDNM